MVITPTVTVLGALQFVTASGVVIAAFDASVKDSLPAFADWSGIGSLLTTFLFGLDDGARLGTLIMIGPESEDVVVGGPLDDGACGFGESVFFAD